MNLTAYKFVEWLLFFYVYCFAGWCFETTYVSLKEKRFVNRGLMSGPMLPIYGSGALVILLSTIGFRDRLWLVGFTGMAAATALEYLAGVFMEAVFKVRYWDYSGQKFNFKGRICLRSTLAWGILSVVLVKFVHPPIERLVRMLSGETQQMAALIVTAVFMTDLTHAVLTALDLRRLLARADEIHKELKRIQQRVEMLEAQLSEGRSERAAQIREELARLRERASLLHEQFMERLGWDKRSLLRRYPSALSQTYKDGMEKLREWMKR